MEEGQNEIVFISLGYFFWLLCVLLLVKESWQQSFLVEFSSLYLCYSNRWYLTFEFFSSIQNKLNIRIFKYNNLHITQTYFTVEEYIFLPYKKYFKHNAIRSKTFCSNYR